MQAHRFTFWTLAATLFAGTLSPAPTAALNNETDLILAELRQLQAQMSQLQRTQIELGRMLRQITTKTGDEDSSLRRIFVDTQTALDDIKEHLSILSSRLDETNGRLGNLRSEMASLRQTQQPLIIPAVPIDTTKGDPAEGTASLESPPSDSAGIQTTAIPVSVAAVAPGPVELYNQAYTDYTQLRYPLAISGFKEVVSRYPESDLADNSQYWIGESLLAQRQFQAALEAFEGVLSTYPNSNKLAEANYKKAIALQSLDRREEAIEQLELVIEQFSRTQVERSAVQRLKQLRRYQP